MRLGFLLVAGACAMALGIAPERADARPNTKTVSSGKTQVVAKVGGREITLSELRVEMARLRVSLADPSAERTALESLITRTLLAKSARDADLHRRPEAIVRMHAAQDQSLADYYLGIASQPAEPTRADIEDYISANPTLFAKRKRYEFSVLSLATEAFDEKSLTPLFDDAVDFTALKSALEESRTNFTVNNATQPSLAFPKSIREQLARYSAGDNIVLKGDAQTQIMKIMQVSDDAGSQSDWAPLARRILLEEAANKRAQGLIARLKEKTGIAYYRESAMPKTDPAPAEGSQTAAANGESQ